MNDRSVTHSTFVIERSYPTTPERVFAAFADPAKKRRWFADGSSHHDVEEYQMDFRVGGAERALYRFKVGTPFGGATYSTDTVYQDIVPNRRIVIVYSTTFSDRRISACLVTMEFLPAEKGTALILTHQGAFFEGSDGPQIREEGWRQLLERLAPELTR